MLNRILLRWASRFASACFITKHSEVSSRKEHFNVENQRVNKTRTNSNLFLTRSHPQRKNGTTLIKIHLIGQLTSFDRQHQSSLLQLYGDAHSSVIIFQLNEDLGMSINPSLRRHNAHKQCNWLKWTSNKWKMLTLIGKRNDLSKVPLQTVIDRVCIAM